MMAKLKGCGPALPDDLVFEVLTRFERVEDLSQYKCVSKSWRSIITHPRFSEARKTRIQHHGGAGGGIVKSFVKYFDFSRDKEKEYEKLIGRLPDHVQIQYWYSTPLPVGITQPINQPLEDNKFSCRIKVPASNCFRGYTELVNGLTCVYEANKRVFVCNVCTGQTLRLPDNEFDRTPLSDFYHTRCFLGYIPGSRGYKLLKLSIVRATLVAGEGEGEEEEPAAHGGFRYGMQSEILTLGGDSSWRKLNDSGVLPIVTHRRTYLSIFSQFVLVNGVMFWNMINSLRRLITFDLNTEKFRLIQPPQDLSVSNHIITQFRGRPALYCGNGHSVAEVEIHITFYALEDDEGYSWSRHTLLFPCPDFQPLRSPESFWCLIPIGNLPTGQILLITSVVPLGDDDGTECFNHIYSYDHHKDKFQRFFVGDTIYYEPLEDFSIDDGKVHYFKWSWLEENYAPLEDLLNLKK